MGDTTPIAITRLPSRSLEDCQLTHLTRAPIDPDKAAAQHAAYRKLLASCGARVITLEADEAHPDAVFVEDPAIVLDEIAVMMSLGRPERRGERAALEAELSRHRPIERIEPPDLIDGGDVLRIGKTLYVGRSSRTDEAGIEALRRIASPYDYEVVPVTVNGCLHLKTACTALDDETILMNPEWIDRDAFSGRLIVEVPPEEPRGGCVLQVGSTVCVSAAYPKTERLVREKGYRVAATDISELHKMEGGLTCLSIMLEAGAFRS